MTRTAVALIVPGLAALVCAVAACDQRPAAPAAPAPPAPPSAPAAPAGTLDLADSQVRASAFRAAWDQAPPVVRTVRTDGYSGTVTYAAGTLLPLGRDRFALVSSGQGGEGHVDAGALAIHYLERTADGFRRVGAWPELTTGGTWGAPPEWSVRADLTPGPALVTEAGGTWQGYTCSWGDVIELTPERPVIRVDGLKTGYSSDGALGDQGRSYEATLEPGDNGRSFRVRYTGVARPVVYARVGETYDPVDPPELPSC